MYYKAVGVNGVNPDRMNLNTRTKKKLLFTLNTLKKANGDF